MNFSKKVSSAFKKLVEADQFAKEHYAGRVKPVVCLPDLDAGSAKDPELAARAHELFEEMRGKGMVRLCDLLEGKVEQAGRINIDEVYRLGQAIGIEAHKHGDFPLTPDKVWVQLSDVTEQSSQPLDRRCKLTPEKVQAIRAAREKGQTLPQLARQYGVSEAQICRIVKDLSWKNT
jgi:hypothetical protein